MDEHTYDQLVPASQTPTLEEVGTVVLSVLPRVQDDPNNTTRYLFDLADENNTVFMYAAEGTDRLANFLCWSTRSLLINIYDKKGVPYIQLSRPYYCLESCLCCCGFKSVNIMCPPGETVGRVSQTWTWLAPAFEVRDSGGNIVFTIRGVCELFTGNMFNHFQIANRNSEIIGTIYRHATHTQQRNGGGNPLRLQFPADLNVQSKKLLLGAAFLINFSYFIRH